MSGKLVATGDHDADTYLRLARTIHGLNLVLAEATAHVGAGRPDADVMWPAAVAPGNPLGYDHACEVVALAPGLIEEARKWARWHYRAAADRRAADLADVHVARLIPAPSLDT